MKFDFDAEHNRRNTDSLKWDVDANDLPMWVADMDFKTAPAITEAIISRANKGIFGYAIVPDKWYDAIIGWWRDYHGLEIKREWLCFCTGVVPAISSIVKRVTNVGDNVVLQTPVYDIFFHSVENAGRRVLENGLIYRDGKYEIDFEDLESKLSHPLTTMMILCNPHNPIGKAWSKEELARIGDLCRKYGVTVLSDEIHCDITDNARYTPFASVSSQGVTCISASKAFNMAGLQSAAVFVPDRTLRNKIVRGLNSDEVAEPNCFAVDAAVAAFTQGRQWLEQMNEYISQNRKIVFDYVENNVKGLKPVKQNATYLLWVDCSDVSDDAELLCNHIRSKTGLFVTSGNQYRGNGKHFIRINVACPRSRLLDGLQRLKNGVETFVKVK